MSVIDKYNIVIIGGGPAGITAGIYAKYDGNNPVIIESKTLAWIPKLHVNLLGKVEGFPGLLNTTDGNGLVRKFKKSLYEMDVPYEEQSSVINVHKQKDGKFVSEVDNKDKYISDALIIATGTYPKIFKCKNSSSYGEDIHYFAYRQYRKYKDRNVIVLGSRNSGSSAAIYLAKHGLKVTIIEKKDAIQAKEKHTKFFEPLNINVITDAEVKELYGKNGKMIEARVGDGKKDIIIPTSAIFVYIGIDPCNQLAKSLSINTDSYGYIQTNSFQECNIKGIFVAGDVCGDLKHIVAAAGQGAKAAYNANKYLMTLCIDPEMEDAPPK